MIYPQSTSPPVLPRESTRSSTSSRSSGRLTTSHLASPSSKPPHQPRARPRVRPQRKSGSDPAGDRRSAADNRRVEGLGGPAYEHLGEVHVNHPNLGLFAAGCDALARPVFTGEEIDRMSPGPAEIASSWAPDRPPRRSWLALEQLDQANNGIVLQRDAAAASAPLRAVALNQLASGPSRWMPGRRTWSDPTDCGSGRARVRSTQRPVASPRGEEPSLPP